MLSGQAGTRARLDDDSLVPRAAGCPAEAGRIAVQEGHHSALAVMVQGLVRGAAGVEAAPELPHGGAPRSTMTSHEGSESCMRSS